MRSPSHPRNRLSDSLPDEINDMISEVLANSGLGEPVNGRHVRESSAGSYDSPLPSSASLYHPNPKIPEFMPSNTATFFSILERTFDRCRITAQADRFEKLVLALSKGELDRINTDLILDESAQPYDDLKERLLREYTPSKSQKLDMFLNCPESAGAKPSVVLQQLKFLIGPDNLKESFAKEWLRKKFYERLPPHIRSALACSPSQDLDHLAAMADRIHAELNDVDMSPIKDQPKLNEMDSKLHDLSTKIENLATKIDQVSKQSSSSFQPNTSNSGYRRYNNSRRSYGRYYQRGHWDEPRGHPQARNSSQAANNQPNASSSVTVSTDSQNPGGHLNSEGRRHN